MEVKYIWWITSSILQRRISTNTIEKWTKYASSPSPRKVTLESLRPTLTTIAAKVYNALFFSRIKPEIEKILWKNQNSFRKNRSTTTPGAMDDRDAWRERVWEIRAVSKMMMMMMMNAIYFDLLLITVSYHWQIILFLILYHWINPLWILKTTKVPVLIFEKHRRGYSIFMNDCYQFLLL